MAITYKVQRRRWPKTKYLSTQGCQRRQLKQCPRCSLGMTGFADAACCTQNPGLKQLRVIDQPMLVNCLLSPPKVRSNGVFRRLLALLCMVCPTLLEAAQYAFHRFFSSGASNGIQPGLYPHSMIDLDRDNVFLLLYVM